MKKIEVERLAALGMIRLEEEEREQMEAELSAMLHFADRISALNTAGVPETAYLPFLQEKRQESKEKIK